MKRTVIVFTGLFLITLGVSAAVYYQNDQKGSVTACAEVTSRSLGAGVITTDYGPECHGLTQAEQDQVSQRVADGL